MGGGVQFRKGNVKSGAKGNYKPVRIDLTNMLDNFEEAGLSTKNYPAQVHPEVRGTTTQAWSLLLDNNAKPTIVSTEELERMKKEKGAIVLSRSTESEESLLDFTDNDYTVQSAGRFNGSKVYGEGNYFTEMDGNTCYGRFTLTGVLDKNAKVITTNELHEWSAGKYKTANGQPVRERDLVDELSTADLGTTALALGYDAIKVSGTNIWVILNRSAVKTDRKIYDEDNPQ